MYKPFKGLVDFSGATSQEETQEKPTVVFENSWEDLARCVKPLKNKNVFWCPSFKKPKSFVEGSIWPPTKLKVKFRLTSEYVEWKSWFLDEVTFNKLKEGKLTVQDRINIRGLLKCEAEEVLEEFFKNALNHNYRCFLVIHGRGLSSKSEPVLKYTLTEWLKKGPYRRYVLGFCSARRWDGGVGATYVLLSTKPIPKKKKSPCY